MYKFSTALYGHSMDVRGVAVTPEGSILSASRDRTAKLWKPNGFNANFTESITFKGHTNFVSCVTFIKSSALYPLGLVVTGSNDKKIAVFEPNRSDPLFTLNEHSNTVCCVSPGSKANVLLSASWDTTAKVWCLETQQCKLTIQAHEMAVWAVIQLSNGTIVTGCADKSIKLHSEEGTFLKTLTSHTDCVRGLAILNGTNFVSCSNDASFKVWDATTGKCVDTLYGHPNFIYGVAAHEDLIATGGEDQCVCVYQNKEQTSFQIPAQSVWAVAILPNSDIVTGSSDGVVRVFSANSQRQADESSQAQYAEDVKKLKKANDQEIGGVKVSDLPGPEALYEPGKSDGQVKMISKGGSVIAYSWSAASGEWTKIGDVMGSAGGTQENSGKILYEGKEYDFVFSVDIEEGKPPLKLPYNVSEDPWFAAQAFIHKHGLSQMFLEQVANFITTNSKSKQPMTISQEAPPSGEFADPFTGGNRYVPGTGNAPSVLPSAGADPFTGDSSYKTAAAVVSNNNASTPAVSFFPLNDFVRFDQANVKAILDKLKQFTEQLRSKPQSDPLVLPSDAQLESLSQLCAQNVGERSEEVLSLLKQLLEWPAEFVFPILDITRLVIRDTRVNQELCGGRTGRQIISLLRNFLNQDASTNNQMLTLKILTNMFSHQPGEELVLSHKEYIFSILDVFSTTKLNKTMQIALVSLLLNCVISYKRRKDQNNLAHSLEILTKMLPNLIEQEALLRALIALGTLICDSVSLRKNVQSGVRDLILKLSEIDSRGADTRVNQCALKLVDYILN